MASDTVMRRGGARSAIHASMDTAEFTYAEELQDTSEPITSDISAACPAHVLGRLHIRTAFIHVTAFC